MMYVYDLCGQSMNIYYINWYGYILVICSDNGSVVNTGIVACMAFLCMLIN